MSLLSLPLVLPSSLSAGFGSGFAAGFALVCGAGLVLVFVAGFASACVAGLADLGCCRGRGGGCGDCGRLPCRIVMYRMKRLSTSSIGLRSSMLSEAAFAAHSLMSLSSRILRGSWCTGIGGARVRGKGRRICLLA